MSADPAPRQQEGAWCDFRALQQRCAPAIEAGDPTELLLTEHDWLENTLIASPGRLEAAAAAAEWRGQLGALHAFILRHVRKEEDVYFPAVEALLEIAGAEVTPEMMYGEHDGVRIRADEALEAAGQGAKAVIAALAHLQHAMSVHFAHEEDLLLQPVRGFIDSELGRTLVQRMEELR